MCKFSVAIAILLVVSTLENCVCYAKIRAHLAILQSTRNMYSILRMEYINKVLIFSTKNRERENKSIWACRCKNWGVRSHKVRWVEGIVLPWRHFFYHQHNIILCSDFISFPLSISDEISCASSCRCFFFASSHK